MKKLSYKISYYVLYVLFAITLVVLGLFYFGGNVSEADRMVVEMPQPIYTDVLLYFTYFLFGLAVAVTLAAFLFQFGASVKDSPVTALKSLVGVIAIAVVLVVSWALSSGEPLALPGYDGTENVPFWLQLTDMFLFTIYFLLGATVLLIIGSSVKNRLS
jgi:hypothetical protein